MKERRGEESRVPDSLVEVGLGDVEVGAVPQSLDGEDERLPGQHGQLANHLTRVGDEEAHVLLLTDHPLVHVEAAREDEVEADVLEEQQEVSVSHTELASQ